MPPQVTHSVRALPAGDAGIRATLLEMRSIVRAWRKHPMIRQLAVELTGRCPDKDWTCEVRALHAWVRDRIRFVADVAEVETLQTPELTLANRAGDCDDQCIVLGSLLQAVGHPVRFVAVDLGAGFSHVFCETPIGAYWVATETTEPWELGRRPWGIKRYMVQNV
jgi:transglutaminase-like putative cysteine protease